MGRPGARHWLIALVLLLLLTLVVPIVALFL